MQTILKQLKIEADIVKVEKNETISKYYLEMHPGAKVSKIENCATEIALGIKSYGKPIIRVIPEQGLVCIEIITNRIKNVNFVDFKDKLIEFDKYSIPIILGKTYDGNSLIPDLSTMPHLLVSGTTGSGKSVLLHSIINSLIMKENIKLALIDPKKVEFNCYENINQLLYPITTESEEAIALLSDLVDEMENRFKIMSKSSVNCIKDYNKNRNRLPYIVLIIDEFSDLMYSSKKEFQKMICSLAQKSRACGIHIIISTQRPSVDVITGLIKANFPSRISCRVSSIIDSRVALNCSGAEKLLGNGDALINSIGFDMVRFQGAYLNAEEVKQLCGFNKRGKISRVINFVRGI
jgi:S-DNA-T family DNA segregation ATPase FtsK/SpoIIIE